MRNHRVSQFDRGNQAVRTGFPGASRVIGGAMIWARPDDRKSERRVHTAPHVERLYWNEPLIVSHGNDGIEIPAEHFVKDRVSRSSICDLNTLGAQMGGNWVDEIHFLAANCAILACVRV